MSRYETRPVFAVLSVMNAYRKVSGRTRKAISLEMGRTTNWWKSLEARGHITVELHDEIMAFVTSRWPQSHAMPSPVRMFLRDHPDKVAASAKGRPTPSGERKCLCCPVRFVSEGPHNRMCPSCRQRFGSLPSQMVG